MAPPLVALSPLSPCEYLPGRASRLRYELVPDIDPDAYMARLKDGWRRFGPVLFRPECPSCRSCRSLRVPAGSFRPSESQRRAWRRNAGEVRVRIGPPSGNPAKRELFTRFHQHGHEAKGWPDGEGNFDLFLQNPFPTEEWSYYLGDRLVALGFVDALGEGLSAIYCVHDPEEGHRSLGTFNILTMIEAARTRGLPHVYLGYYVEGCRSLEYKARFRPNEILTGGGEWQPFGRDRSPTTSEGTCHC